jgi:hypothetical protein
MARTCWWYYISKFTEFFDTIFFILRKKTQHVSTLHVIHHGCMPFSVWMGLKFAPGKRFDTLLKVKARRGVQFRFSVASVA